MFNEKTLFLYQQSHISEPIKIRFVVVVTSLLCSGGGVLEVDLNRIKHTLLKRTTTIETAKDTMTTTRSLLRKTTIRRYRIYSAGK